MRDEPLQVQIARSFIKMMDEASKDKNRLCSWQTWCEAMEIYRRLMELRKRDRLDESNAFGEIP